MAPVGLAASILSAWTTLLLAPKCIHAWMLSEVVAATQKRTVTDRAQQDRQGAKEHSAGQAGAVLQDITDAGV